MTQKMTVSHDLGRRPGATWQPVVGPETLRLLDQTGLDQTGADRVRDQSVDILSRCGGPAEAGTRTGLVVGYVQSGKTLSFTTVVSLARDNEIPLVILLAGTKRNLHDQTCKRLAKDLAFQRDGGMSPWAGIEDPVATKAAQVAQHVKQMVDLTAPDMFRRTTVITVMKNRAQLDKLTELIAALPRHGVDLDSLPVLMIDDEADQAGLNAAVASADPTATYQAIMDLRAVVPRHTYLMYTATPQAPLLINLADTLSPDFVTVLEPGNGYTGGEYFFGTHRDRFVRRLSSTAVQEALRPDVADPPLELQRAMGSFFLVLAGRQGKSTASMLVHPSHKVDLQGQYRTFVVALKDAWARLLSAAGPDRDQLVSTIFSPAYEDLSNGGAELPPLDDLMEHMTYWIGAVQVRLVNADTPEDNDIAWNTAPGWILIGGNKLDRGFTIEGLTTTYMPRRLGGGQVDTVQQRARFFGYKASYGEVCRAWLSGPTSDAFEHYVEHEQLLRRELQRVASAGMSLKQWKRQMLLDSAYKPTRRAVIDLPYFHDRIRPETWLSLGQAQHPSAASSNLAAVERMRGRRDLVFETAAQDPRAQRRHERTRTSLKDVLELLVDWQCELEDRALVNQAALLLGARLDADPNLEAEVFLMDGFAIRERSRSKTGRLTLQQGRSPSGDYPGDAAFVSADVASVQLHHVSVKGADEPTEIAGISLWLPSALAGGFLVQVDE